MTAVLFFAAGLFIGGSLGVLVAALMAASAESAEQLETQLHAAEEAIRRHESTICRLRNQQRAARHAHAVDAGLDLRTMGDP